jgi:hypothetical protein
MQIIINAVYDNKPGFEKRAEKRSQKVFDKLFGFYFRTMFDFFSIEDDHLASYIDHKDRKKFNEFYRDRWHKFLCVLILLLIF